MQIKKLVFVAVALGIAAGASAQVKPEDQIKFRKAGYAFMSWNMGKIKAQVIDNPGSFNKDQVAAAASLVAATANSGMGALYGPGTDKDAGSQKTRVKPEFFKEPDGNLYGVGIGVLPATSGSNELRTMVLPVIQASYADRFYINAPRAGVWLLDSDDRRLRFGLAADARFGWDANDSTRTKGMHDRDFSIDVGPALRWQTDYGTLNAQWGFDTGGASKGHSVQVQFVRALIRGPALRLNGLVGLTWNDSRMNDYYFGVAPTEVAPGRPSYRAGAGTQWQAGINGAWPTGQRGSVLFGLMATRLGNAQAESPIVETRIQPLAYLGYGWTF